jgi:hypothetical protein
MVNAGVLASEERTMVDVLLLLAVSIVGAGVLWVIAQAIILGGGLLEQALEWFVSDRQQDAKLLWPWSDTDPH